MIESINKILSEWDPINIGSPNSLDEYKHYAPMIVPLLRNEHNLKLYLINALKNMGLDYDANNEVHVADVDKVVRKLIKLTH